MNIRLTKPLPQPSLGRVIPAGVIIDAPAGLSERLLRQGHAEYPEARADAQAQPEAPGTKPETVPPEAEPNPKPEPKAKARKNGGRKSA